MIADSPLTPRRDHQEAWTGEEMLIVGGDGPRDGAAYDPTTDTWRSLPDTPIQTSGDPAGAAPVGNLATTDVLSAGSIATSSSRRVQLT